MTSQIVNFRGAFTTVMPKARRKGKILVDFLRNTRGNTAIAAYSTRARAGAPVAVPLAREELSPSLDPAVFTLASVPERLRKLKRGPWAALLHPRQSLPASKR